MATLPTNIEGWVGLSEQLGDDAFVARFDRPFFFTGEIDQESGFEFRTAMVSVVELQKLAADDGLVLPLVKSDRNPYERVLIGRTRNCDVVLKEPSVSKFHADLEVLAGDRARLKDRGSSNGTFVDQRRLDPGEVVEIRTGTLLHFGSAPAMFVSARDLLGYF